MGGTVLMWQQKQGGADDDRHIGDVACPGAANRWLGGQWGADPGCDSPGGTLFHLLLAVAGSVIVVAVEPVVRGWISLAWLTQVLMGQKKPGTYLGVMQWVVAVVTVAVAVTRCAG